MSKIFSKHAVVVSHRGLVSFCYLSFTTDIFRVFSHPFSRYNEIGDYDFATGKKTGKHAIIGHFTQVRTPLRASIFP